MLELDIGMLKAPVTWSVDCWVTCLDTIKFEDAYVHPKYRGQGIYRQLWERRWDYVTSHCKGMRVVAYCKPKSINLYMEKNFEVVEEVILVKKII